MQHPTILALDISSVAIGYVIYCGAVEAAGEILLKHDDINQRCRLARAQIGGLLVEHPDIDAAAIEEHVLRRFTGKNGQRVDTAKALIQQCLVSGAVRSLIAERQILLCDDVAQAVAKKTLTGKGNCDKRAMQTAALAYGVRGEHASDALGVALACVGRVKVVEVAA